MPPALQEPNVQDFWGGGNNFSLWVFFVVKSQINITFISKHILVSPVTGSYHIIFWPNLTDLLNVPHGDFIKTHIELVLSNKDRSPLCEHTYPTPGLNRRLAWADAGLEPTPGLNRRLAWPDAWHILYIILYAIKLFFELFFELSSSSSSSSLTLNIFELQKSCML